MSHSPLMVAALFGCLVSACAHTPGSESMPASASVTASAAQPRGRPVMDGTCSVTEGSNVRTFTYLQGRLTHSTAAGEYDYRTTYTYDDERLGSIERSVQDDVAFRKVFHYDPNGRLEAIITLVPRIDPPTPLEMDRRVFEYDAAGHLVRFTESTPHSGPSQVCSVGYDEQERLASYTCEFPGREQGPRRTTYHYDTAGRLSELRPPDWILRFRYDAAGRQEHLEAISEGGEVATATMIRDAEGHEIERRTTTRGGQVAVEVMAFEGTFGPGAECGAVPPPPPGVPEHGQSIWFEMSP